MNNDESFRSYLYWLFLVRETGSYFQLKSSVLESIAICTHQTLLWNLILSLEDKEMQKNNINNNYIGNTTLTFLIKILNFPVPTFVLLLMLSACNDMMVISCHKQSLIILNFIDVISKLMQDSTNFQSILISAWSAFYIQFSDPNQYFNYLVTQNL